jgi:DNA adenine methylase
MLPYFPQKLTSEQKCHGGKHYLCRRLFQHAPKTYRRYADLFLGAGSMTYNAPEKLFQQVAVDINFCRYISKHCIRNHLKELTEGLQFALYAEETFQLGKKFVAEWEAAGKSPPVEVIDECRLAAAWIIKCRMSRGGLGDDFAYSERLRGKKRVGGPIPGDINAWDTMIARLPALSARLQPIHLFCGDALHWISKIGSESKTPEEWFVYLDPSYMRSTRTGKANEYGDDEVTDEQHHELVRLVKLYPRVNFAISHYKHDLYESLGWRKIVFNMPNNAGQGKVKERRTECLYLNYIEP